MSTKQQIIATWNQENHDRKIVEVAISAPVLQDREAVTVQIMLNADSDEEAAKRAIEIASAICTPSCTIQIHSINNDNWED